MNGTTNVWDPGSRELVLVVFIHNIQNHRYSVWHWYMQTYIYIFRLIETSFHCAHDDDDDDEHDENGEHDDHDESENFKKIFKKNL